MTPEAARYLDKAQQRVANAQISLSVKLTNDAGRSAYLAAFHAAQALIFEHTGKVAKTHKGVHTMFARLVKRESQLDDSLPSFLQRTYNLKAVADYETGPDSNIALERAAIASTVRACLLMLSARFSRGQIRPSLPIVKSARCPRTKPL